MPELMRGKIGRMNGHPIALLTLMKGQPLAYNKDNQEDNEPLFDAVDTLVDSLAIFPDMMGSHIDAAIGERVWHVKVRSERMRRAAVEGYATATDLADYLVKKGLPSRAAHEAVARAVRAAEQRGRDLADLSLEALRAFSPLVREDVYAVLTLEGSLSLRDHIGGTAP